MRDYIINIFNKEMSNEKFLNILFWIAALVFTFLSFLRLLYGIGLLMDTNEHIHASYLISTGLVPYRDFFEHHHPLLWYLMLPVVSLFDRNVNIIYAARFIAILGYFVFLLLFYKIAKRYANNNTCGAQIAVLAFLSISPIWYDVQNLRPDIFMYISILAALIYFFDYLTSMQRRYLCYSYFCWFVAFLFLQKAAVTGLGFIVANAWLYLNKKIKLSDILAASIFPLLCLCTLLFILYKTDTLSHWWLYNFTFNTHVKSYYGDYSAGLSYLPAISCILAMIIIRQYKVTAKTIAIFIPWVCIALQLLYFSPYVQYFVLYFAFSIILIIPVLLKMFYRNFLPFMVAVIFFICSSASFNYLSYNSRNGFSSILAMMDYIIQHSDSNDYLQNFPHTYNLFNRDIHYYWFGFNNAAIIADLYLNRGFDLNEQIKKHRPKFITIPIISLDLVMYQHSAPIRNYNTMLLKKAAKGDKNALKKLSDVNIDYWLLDMDYIKQHYRHVGTYDNTTQLWERIDD